MAKLMSLTLTVALLVHGYFYLRYDTVHPCRAALVRAVEDQDPLFTVGARALLGGQTSDRALMVVGKALANEKGYFYCYRISLMGTPNAKTPKK